jgi:hypothetical protein
MQLLKCSHASSLNHNFWDKNSSKPRPQQPSEKMDLSTYVRISEFLNNYLIWLQFQKPCFCVCADPSDTSDCSAIHIKNFLQLTSWEAPISSIFASVNTVACRPVARQWPWNKQLHKSHCEVTAPERSIFPQQQLHWNRGTVFSMQSALRCYKQGQLAVAVSELVTGLLWFSHCELLLLEAGSWGLGEFGKPQDRECPPLEAATKHWQWRCDYGRLCVCVCVCV